MHATSDQTCWLASHYELLQLAHDHTTLPPYHAHCSIYSQPAVSYLSDVHLNTMLGKRFASDMEACLTEYYRQECLRSLYVEQNTFRDCTWIHKDMMAKPTRRLRKGVSFAMVPEIIGRADPTVDRSSIHVSPVSNVELTALLSERTFPVQA